MCKKSLPGARRGSVLPLALIVIVLLLVMGLGMLRLGLQARVYAARTSDGIAARTGADAGLTKAIYDMNQKLKTPPWDDSTLPSASNVSLPGCSATYSYTVTKSGSNYAVTATGSCGQIQKQVSCTLVVNNPFDFPVFGNSYLWFANGCTVDQYNTTPGTPPLQIGTNNTERGWVFISNDCVINGDVVVGPGGDPANVITNHGTITGNQYAMPTPNTLESVTVPSSLASMGSLGKLTGGSVTASGKYSKIDLGNKKILTIEGPVTLYVTGDVSLGNGAQIIVDNTTPNSSLTLYLGGNLSSDKDSNINNLTQNPRNMEIFALDSCTKIILKNSSAFYGAIYAPKAQVLSYNSGATYGSVIADAFGLYNTGAFHYDVSLRNATVNDPLVKFTVTQWSEN